MKTLKRTFKCTGCGEDRPCFVESNQEEFMDFSNPVEDLVCILDSTNVTSYNWVETTETVLYEITLFKMALNAIDKSYSYEQLKTSDALYGKSESDISLCLNYYEEIQAKGTTWAYNKIK